jgi:K+-transporting ATPase ATPase C chain
MTLLLGIAYPLIVTGFGKLFFKATAEGSLIYVHEKAVGSRWIAQKFQTARYFWPRPSAVDYSTLPSGGSNLSPTSKTLQKAVEERVKNINLLQPASIQEIPSELLYASGSGLDPHISVKAARFQVERIAKARGIPSSVIENLIQKSTEKPLLGPSRVNVLLLNLALDEDAP